MGNCLAYLACSNITGLVLVSISFAGTAIFFFFLIALSRYSGMFISVSYSPSLSPFRLGLDYSFPGLFSDSGFMPGFPISSLNHGGRLLFLKRKTQTRSWQAQCLFCWDLDLPPPGRSLPACGTPSGRILPTSALTFLPWPCQRSIWKSTLSYCPGKKARMAFLHG